MPKIKDNVDLQIFIDKYDFKAEYDKDTGKIIELYRIQGFYIRERRIKKMEDEIQDKLEEIYNFRIDVKFKDSRQYEVYAQIDNEKAFTILILYDARSTIEANIRNIKNRIDAEIVELFRRKEK